MPFGVPKELVNDQSKGTQTGMIPENQAKIDAKLHNQDFSKSAWKISSADGAMFGNSKKQNVSCKRNQKSDGNTRGNLSQDETNQPGQVYGAIPKHFKVKKSGNMTTKSTKSPKLTKSKAPISLKSDIETISNTSTTCDKLNSFPDRKTNSKNVDDNVETIGVGNLAEKSFSDGNDVVTIANTSTKCNMRYRRIDDANIANAFTNDIAHKFKRNFSNVNSGSLHDHKAKTANGHVNYVKKSRSDININDVETISNTSTSHRSGFNLNTKNFPSRFFACFRAVIRPKTHKW